MKDSSTHNREANLVPPLLRGYVPIVGAVLMGLALFGYLSGIREPRPIVRLAPVPLEPAGEVPTVVDYSELPTANLKPDPLTGQTLASLQVPTPGIFDVVVRTEDMKLAALADRSRNRAYDGAPPTIPHPVDARASAACLACHENGIKVGDRVASRMSHASMSHCTQCHVEQQPRDGEGGSVEVHSGFVGVYRSGPGSRASVGAPPTIPHHTWMRENCASCHGLVTRPGIRTTHPWLTNCTQCHAPSAERDQTPFTEVKS